MKRKFRIFAIMFALVCILTSQAFALTFYYRASSGYDLIWSDDFVIAEIFDLLFSQEFTAICDATPYASSYTYKVVVSYDELAGLVTTANTHQLNTSLYRNDAAGYWVAKVHDFDGNPWFTNDNTPRVLGNPNGYVYVAEIDTTGEDTVSLLDSILVRLTLVESYVKSTYFELWEQGGVLDDIYDAIDSIDGYVYDIKDRLYYNGKSAAYYLYKIESHLASIANNSGTSGGSSSGTDLSGVLELLDDVAQWTFDTKEYLYSISEKLDSSNSFLYELTFDMESVLINQSDLLLSLSSYGSDILEELEWASGLIGTISLDTDALVTGMDDTQDLIAAANTNLTTMITNQDSTFDYLADLSGDLSTVISNQNTALPVLQSISGSLDTIVKRLTYSDTGIVYYAYRINNYFRGEFAEKIDTIIALLQQEGAFTTDLSGVLGDLGTVISNQETTLALLQQEGAFTTDLSGVLANQEEILTKLTYFVDNLYFDSTIRLMTDTKSLVNWSENIWDRLNTLYLLFLDYDDGLPALLRKNDEIIYSLSADGLIGDGLNDILTYTHLLEREADYFHDDFNSFADQISKQLTHNNYGITYWVWSLGGLVESSVESILSNQNTALPVLQTMSESLSSIKNRLYYVDASVSYYVYAVNKKLGDQLPVMVANQEAELANQQKIIDLLEDLEHTSVENIQNITIDINNDAYEIFYITDADGNDQNLADFSGDVLTITGRLLNFFFKVAFDDAMDSVDSALDDMTEFYLDDSVVVGGSSLWE